MDTLFVIVEGEVKVTNGALNNKNIKALIRRDRGGVMAGDSNGTKKLRAMAELGVIWYCLNLNSPGIQNGYKGKDLEIHAVTYFGLPDDWKADEIYNTVYNDYSKYYNDNIVVKAIKSLLQGFNRSISLIDKFNRALDVYDDSDDLNVDQIADFIKVNKELMGITGSLPEQIDRLKGLEESYLKVERKQATGRGGVDITSSMNP